MEWELRIMKDNLEIIRLHYEVVDGYEERIKTMQELIDYNEWVVNDAINVRYERWWKDKALDYLEKNYIIWGYEDESISRDENAYNEIWWED